MNFSLSVSAIVVALGAVSYAGIKSTQADREHVTVLAKSVQHMADLAAAAEPVHPIERDGKTWFRCVSETGWQYTAPTAREAQESCVPAKPHKTKAGAAIPQVDVYFLNQIVKDHCAKHDCPPKK